ncbi:MAG: NAD(P)/FAD-dependent oxidoreductase [Rhodoferax sp.]|nr:NAD(P)/FAD-dependent oxidoreductase [Rhodoferax sp.]
MAIQLQRAGIHDFVILEKQVGLGGTWWDNTYPGAHVDVPAPVYSFSFASNPDWKQRFAAAPEIQAYMQKVAERYRLLAHMRLATRITEATFDEATGHWQFATDRGDTLRSRFFVCSTGPLNQLRWPDIAGLDVFQGKRLHSARWDHNHDITGQRVAVIGTGSTGITTDSTHCRQGRPAACFPANRQLGFAAAGSALHHHGSPAGALSSLQQTGALGLGATAGNRATGFRRRHTGPAQHAENGQHAPETPGT